MRFRFWAIFLSCLSLSFPAILPAEEEDEDFPPGLTARYSLGDRLIERIDTDIAFNWNGASPDPRLPTGNFRAEWTSQLLLRQALDYRFHAYLTGDVEVTIDGKTVLAGRTDRPGWISGQPISLGFGEKSLRVDYRKTGKNARVSLYWSSSTFPIEPVSPYLLFRDGGHELAARIERGRKLFDVHRCNRCHQRPNDSLGLPAPALTHVAGQINPDWLFDQIVKPSDLSSHAKMPRYGFSNDEARAVATFLWKNSRPLELETLPEPAQQKNGTPITASEEQQQGEFLFESLGCLACHKQGKYGNDRLYGGGDLSTIGRKRTRAWLYTWLSDPAKSNRDHRMPAFNLEPSERRALAMFLAERGQESNVTPRQQIAGDVQNAQLVAQGKKLVEASRCAACHRIEGISADLSTLADLSDGTTDREQSCLAENVDRSKRRPVYDNLDHQAVSAFVNSRRGSISAESRFVRGQHVLQRRNCIDCHERGLKKGIVQTAGRISRDRQALNGQSQALIPPALTAVGDKLLDTALTEAVSGDQKSVRLPWLLVRMPRFLHTAAEKEALLAYLIDHDRIPPGAPQGQESNSTQLAREIQMLEQTHTLVGPKGFVCISCHEIGSYKPRNVALGTRGSNLLMLGKRMREPYFLRWTRSPLRIVPGMEMPSYTRPIPGILAGNVDAQLAATWDALNDPDFVTPTNPSTIEQSLVVTAGESPRVIREVFTNPTENGGGYVARAVAVGFHNGHNLLFDLDRAALRRWTVGDFARQRTVGKSWHWDLAGDSTVPNFGSGADIILRKRNQNDNDPVYPLVTQGAAGQLVDYRTLKKNGETVFEIRYRIAFEIDGRVHGLIVTELLRPIERDANFSAGWERSVSINSTDSPTNPSNNAATLPADFDIFIARPHFDDAAAGTKITETKITVADNSPATWVALGKHADRRYRIIPLAEADRTGPPAIRLRYQSILRHEAPVGNRADSGAPSLAGKIISVPGYDGVRLPLDRKIMPTAITWTSTGTLAFTSLNGNVYLAHDTDGDGLEDKLALFEEGLAAPFGLIADGDDLIVSHKPEVLRLRDTDGDGRADFRMVVASGWGYTDNYHDWTTGIVRDSRDNLYVGLGSDYAQSKRPEKMARWRGKVLRIDPAGEVTPIGHSFRYPTGLAIDAQDNIFVSDNQGVQNTFNEINHLIAGNHYGVPSRHEPAANIAHVPPAIQVPHPWTRSVNGLFFLKNQSGSPLLEGHGIGCEYDSRFLIRFTTQTVDDVLQGATYYFSLPNAGTGSENFLGPLCGAVGPDGRITIGSIHDSGWQGGQNTGELAHLIPNGSLPNGMRELRATADGFEIEFFGPIDRLAASKPENYQVSGYKRLWKGGYATPDSGRHTANINSIDVSTDDKRVRLHLDRLRTGHVYEVSCGRIGGRSARVLWPDTGHYTLHRIPSAAP